MAEVYFYLPVEEADIAAECGLKLSKWGDRDIVIEGEVRRCISTLFNPRDDIEKFKSGSYKCFKLDINSKSCFVADRYLYGMGANCPEAALLYRKLIIPFDEYALGTCRLPECLVSTTILPEQIKLLGKKLDTPIFYDNSEELYINYIIENYKDMDESFNDYMLFCFYCRLADEGLAQKLVDDSKGIAAFILKGEDRPVVVKIPYLEHFERLSCYPAGNMLQKKIFERG